MSDKKVIEPPTCGNCLSFLAPRPESESGECGKMGPPNRVDRTMWCNEHDVDLRKLRWRKQP